jgi:hypothetical protein
MISDSKSAVRKDVPNTVSGTGCAFGVPACIESIPTLILITDGEITETKPVVQGAKAHGHAP